MTKSTLRILFIFELLCVCLSLDAQSGNAYGAYSPYTVFGIGDISSRGTAYNKSMGGVGLASRNRRFINCMNPAAITAMDSCSFMLDFGITQNNKIFDQELNGAKYRSGNNTFNLSDFIIAFPIYKSSAMMIGITPFSDVGYDYTSYETDRDIIGVTNNVTRTYYGEGSVYQLFVGAGATFWKRFSVGAEFDFYFGTLDKAFTMDFEDSALRDINAGSTVLVRSFTGKLGLQYEQPLGKSLSLIMGATYRLGTKMRGITTQYEFAESSVRDTISHNILDNKNALRMADELGVGISLKGGERWSVEFNYLRSDWRNTNISDAKALGYDVASLGFSSSVSQSFRAGFEIVPNRNDIRYYMRKCAYRAGVYYDQAYYKFNGNRVDSYGITLGMTFPVYRLYNGISIGIDLGQKGNMRNNMVREMYMTFNIGFNIHDIWFQKQRYE